MVAYGRYWPDRTQMDLKITDRKKDLIKTSGGKYVAPQKLEGKNKGPKLFVSQAIVHGNARNFLFYVGDTRRRIHQKVG